MPFQILNASNPVEAKLWDTLVDELPIERRDIHFTSAYARVQEKMGGRAVLAAQTGDALIIQPFLIRPIFGTSSLDLCNLYGYGGAISSNASIERGATFRSEVERWCARENIVAEFCRLHPLHAGHQFSLTVSIASKLNEDKSVAIMRLDNLSEAEVARRVRRALKNMKTLGVVTEQKIDDVARLQFALLYQQSMKRKQAADRWQFSREYLDAHFDELGARLFCATDGDGWRMLMVIGGYGTAYAHLLASNGESMRSGLDEKLYFDTAMMLRADGYKLFHLGGGLSQDESDTLLAFKRGLCQLEVTTFCYRQVFDEGKYKRLMTEKVGREFAEHGRESISPFFPAYRREFA